MIKHIRLCSDLHREFWRDNSNWIQGCIPSDDRDKDSILILAGDIFGHMWLGIQDILPELISRFAQVLFIPGNHDYWTNTPKWNIKDMNRWSEELTNSLPKAIVCSQDALAEIDLTPEITLLACTLWTDCGKDRPLDEIYISSFPDFKRIMMDRKTLATTRLIRDLHTQQLTQLETRLKELDDKKKVLVATHHLPSYQLCDPFYGPNGDSLFASNLDRLFGQSFSPKLWMHGHTHVRIDTKLGETMVICNPMGYPGEARTAYEPRLFIDLEMF